MQSRKFASLAALVAIAASGCTATTNLTVAQAGSEVAVKKTTSTAVPRSETLNTTSFGNYEFKATSPGLEPLSGILPLKFNGGYLAADILFFAPAMFFNLREPFAHYEFDLKQRVVRYRAKPQDAWMEYRPTPAETTRAEGFFAK
jgi:hypothetical protein